MEKVQAYSRQLFKIVTAAQTEFAQFGLVQREAYGNQVRTLVADVAKSAPAGSEASIAALDSAMAAANTFYETLQRTGQQAVEVTQSNLDIAAVAASKSIRRAVEPAAQATKR
jgi:hypothetical protein